MHKSAFTPWRQIQFLVEIMLPLQLFLFCGWREPLPSWWILKQTPQELDHRQTKMVDVEKAPVKNDDAHQILTYFPHTFLPHTRSRCHSQSKHWQNSTRHPSGWNTRTSYMSSCTQSLVPLQTVKCRPGNSGEGNIYGVIAMPSCPQISIPIALITERCNKVINMSERVFLSDIKG